MGVPFSKWWFRIFIFARVGNVRVRANVRVAYQGVRSVGGVEVFGSISLPFYVVYFKFALLDFVKDMVTVDFMRFSESYIRVSLMRV